MYQYISLMDSEIQGIILKEVEKHLKDQGYEITEVHMALENARDSRLVDLVEVLDYTEVQNQINHYQHEKEDLTKAYLNEAMRDIHKEPHKAKQVLNLILHDNEILKLFAKQQSDLPIPENVVTHKLQQHSLWLESDGTEGERATFENMNLAYNFKYHDLNQVVFTNCRMQSNCNFRNSNLTGSIFESNQMPSVDFSYSNIKNTSFYNNDLSDASFEGSLIHKVNYSECDLNASSFANASLNKVSFTDCNLEYMIKDFNDEQYVDYTKKHKKNNYDLGKS